MAIDWEGTKEVTVREWDGSSPFPDTLDEMIEMLEEAREEIPEEYRAEATFECRGSDDGYGANFITGEITYRRRKTDEEKAAEAAKAQAEAIAIARQREAQERAAYELLKRKYG